MTPTICRYCHQHIRYIPITVHEGLCEYRLWAWTWSVPAPVSSPEQDVFRQLAQAGTRRAADAARGKATP